MSTLDRIFLLGKIIVRLALFLSLVVLTVSIVLRIMVAFKGPGSFYDVFIVYSLSASFFIAIFSTVFLCLQWLLMHGEVIKESSYKNEVKMLSIVAALTLLLWLSLELV